jgi:hypothetical protein
MTSMPHRVLSQRQNLCTRLATIACVLLLGACATPPQAPGSESLTESPQPVPTAAPPLPPISNAEQDTLRNWVVQQDRLYRVAAPLLVNNIELCRGNARSLLGFTAKNRYSYSSDFAEAAQKMFGLEERLQVMDVLPGSGAAKAGIKRGDVLLSAQDKALPQGEEAERKAAAILGPLVSSLSIVKLSVLRNGQQMTVPVPLTRACGFSIELGNADVAAAYADGRRMMITRGMLGFVRSDQELAYVLAREMAHNALGHAQKLKMSAAAGSVIDNLIRMHPDKTAMRGTSGVKPMPQELDTAADKLAVYLAARAGYGIDNAAAFWKRLAFEYPPSVANGYTALHPATLARVTMIENTVLAIRQKQADKKPLMP